MPAAKATVVCHGHIRGRGGGGQLRTGKKTCIMHPSRTDERECVREREREIWKCAHYDKCVSVGYVEHADG